MSREVIFCKQASSCGNCVGEEGSHRGSPLISRQGCALGLHALRVLAGMNETLAATPAPHTNYEGGEEALLSMAVAAVVCEVASMCWPVGRYPAGSLNARAPAALHVAAAVLGWWFAAMALNVSNHLLLRTALDGAWQFPITTAALHISIKFAVAGAVVWSSNSPTARRAREATLPVLLKAGGAVGAATGRT